MAVDFIYPYYLLIFPVVAFIIILISKNRVFKNRFQKSLVVFFRLLTVFFIVLSISGINIQKQTNMTTTIFNVDSSASVLNSEDEIDNFINDAIKFKNEKNDLTNIIYFAKNIVHDSADKNIIDNNFTNIKSSLEMSKSLFPPDTKKRIVLLSDGSENIGNALEYSQTLIDEGIVIDVFKIENQIQNEVQISEFNIKKNVSINTVFSIGVSIFSLSDTNAVLTLSRDNHVIIEQKLKINKGNNNFTFDDLLSEEGNYTYKAEIKAESDTYYQNNVMYSAVNAESSSKILIIQKNNSGENIKNILESSYADISLIEAENSPNRIDELSLYNAVILANIDITDMPDNFPVLIESYVRDTGGGVFVTGGENAFALGGYKDTPLETLLPVEMDLTDNVNLPDLGLVIILDKSGSMSSGDNASYKIELAKESVIRSIDTLNDNDSIGIIAFNDSYEWIADLQKIQGNKNKITDEVYSVISGGGSVMLPALKDAAEKLINYDSKIKHIILFTDGQTDTDGFNDVVNDLDNNNITLSAVAVGNDADFDFLNSLTEKGKGRYYHAESFDELPKIFADETMKAGKRYINSKRFYPKVNKSVITDGITDIPIINGYIETTLKQNANIILSDEEGEPVLSVWNYGLGKSAAWTSDIQNWNNEWLETENGVNILKNTVSWILKSNGNGAEFTIQNDGRESVIISDYNTKDNIKSLKGNLTNGNDSFDLEFYIDSFGNYISNFNPELSGRYVLTAEAETANGKELNSSVIYFPYSSEYDMRYIDNGLYLLEKLAEVTGGKILYSSDEVFYNLKKNIYKKSDLSILFLFLAITAFLTDISIRTISYVYNIAEKAYILACSFINIKKFHNFLKKPFKSKEKYVYNVGKSKNKSEDITNSDKGKSTSGLLVSNKKKRSGR